jgi:hypothetical protein
VATNPLPGRRGAVGAVGAGVAVVEPEGGLVHPLTKWPTSPHRSHRHLFLFALNRLEDILASVQTMLCDEGIPKPQYAPLLYTHPFSSSACYTQHESLSEKPKASIHTPCICKAVSQSIVCLPASNLQTSDLRSPYAIQSGSLLALHTLFACLWTLHKGSKQASAHPTSAKQSASEPVVYL